MLILIKVALVIVFVIPIIALSTCGVWMALDMQAKEKEHD